MATEWEDVYSWHSENVQAELSRLGDSSAPVQHLPTIAHRGILVTILQLLLLTLVFFGCPFFLLLKPFFGCLFLLLPVSKLRTTTRLCPKCDEGLK